MKSSINSIRDLFGSLPKYVPRISTSSKAIKKPNRQDLMPRKNYAKEFAQFLKEKRANDVKVEDGEIKEEGEEGKEEGEMVEKKVKAPRVPRQGGKPKKREPMYFKSCSGLIQNAPGSFGNRKYTVEVKYVNKDGKDANKACRFGHWDKLYYAEISNPSPQDEYERRKMVNRLTHDNNWLYEKFWEENVLLRQDVHDADAALLMTIKELKAAYSR